MSDRVKVILVGNCGAGWDAAALPPDRPIDPNSWGQRKLLAIKKRRQETGEDLQTAKAWVEANVPMKRVLRNSLSAFWDGHGNLDVIGWVSEGDDAPHIWCPNATARGNFQSLGLVSYDWLSTVAHLPIDLDTRLVNDEPLASLLPEKLGFGYYDYRV